MSLCLMSAGTYGVLKGYVTCIQSGRLEYQQTYDMLDDKLNEDVCFLTQEPGVQTLGGA